MLLCVTALASWIHSNPNSIRRWKAWMRSTSPTASPTTAHPPFPPLCCDGKRTNAKRPEARALACYSALAAKFTRFPTAIHKDLAQLRDADRRGE